MAIKIVGIFVGATLGIGYWYFWGCTEGCMLSSVWWRMGIWGGIMGYLLGSAAVDYISSTKEAH